MAGRKKETDSPDRTVRAKKPIGKISILICIFVAALVINGVFWIVDLNVRVHKAEEALSELKASSLVQNIDLSELKAAAYSAEKTIGGSYDAFVRNAALQKWSIAKNQKHGLFLEDRKKMTLTGVTEVMDFGDRKITVVTELGELTIAGSDLHIENFDVEARTLRVRGGTIDSLVYSNREKTFWKRVHQKFGTRLNSV